jgi:hypothetical protein
VPILPLLLFSAILAVPAGRFILMDRPGNSLSWPNVPSPLEVLLDSPLIHLDPHLLKICGVCGGLAFVLSSPYWISLVFSLARRSKPLS